MSKIKDDPQKMWKKENNRHGIKLPCKTDSKECGFKSRISEVSFKDWEMLVYGVKSSSRSFCRAWDRVIIGRDHSDRLVRNLRIGANCLAMEIKVPQLSGRLTKIGGIRFWGMPTTVGLLLRASSSSISESLDSAGGGGA
ncbi:hypothetical protein TNCV_4045381 [Trichonephila clavipes]|nr:hypothetical protein TNCV_4045381 [Trichonephila clavipes]